MRFVVSNSPMNRTSEHVVSFCYFHALTMISLCNVMHFSNIDCIDKVVTTIEISFLLANGVVELN